MYLIPVRRRNNVKTGWSESVSPLPKSNENNKMNTVIQSICNGFILFPFISRLYGHNHFRGTKGYGDIFCVIFTKMSCVDCCKVSFMWSTLIDNTPQRVERENNIL